METVNSPVLWTVVIALAVVGAAVAAGRAWPSIHDITTDVDDPPKFVALLPYRTGRVSPPEYDGPAAAAQQRRAYPDIRPLVVAATPAATFAAALAVARDSGWQIVAERADEGRIEAIASTALMRFKDDVVIRIRADAGGARIDVRSKSRVGTGDLGANARRIRGFLAAVPSRLATP